jgi:hypothetical protein
LPIALVLCALPGAAQETQDYQIYSERPRLFLSARRIRLLQRERERQSIRWQQFDSLMAGKARLPEPGFAAALYSVVTAKPAYCQEGATWAISQAKPTVPADLRQIALVYDWCAPSLSESQAGELSRRLLAALRTQPQDITAVRSRLLAALAVADVDPKAAESVCRDTFEIWWKAFTPKLKEDLNLFERREQLYALIEIVHAARDNFKTDLREDAPRYFEELPPYQLLNYYPQPWPAPENEYRIPIYSTNGDPDLREATLSRAAELALVAYDGNPQPIQFLQGWLMQDRFLMRGALGAPYEFFWANPYLPGLSFSYMPDMFRSKGILLLRSSWDDDATWFGQTHGRMQFFHEGKRVAVNMSLNLAPIDVGDVRIHFWKTPMHFEAGIYPPVTEEGEKRVTEELAFVVGLKPGQSYDIEIDQEEMQDARADQGGIIALKFARGRKTEVRIKEAHPAATNLR